MIFHQTSLLVTILLVQFKSIHTTNAANAGYRAIAFDFRVYGLSEQRRQKRPTYLTLMMPWFFY